MTDSSLQNGLSPVGAVDFDVLNVTFRLGCLTQPQIESLVERRVSSATIYRSISRLGSMIGNSPPMLKRLSHVPSDGSKWVSTYALTEQGLRTFAGQANLNPRTARSLYNQVYNSSIVDHALLRNAYYESLANDLRRSNVLTLSDFCGESGVTPIRARLENEAGEEVANEGFLNPDGLVEFFDGWVSEVATGPTSYPTDADRPVDRPVLPSSHRVYIELDTGTEAEWQIARKVRRYAVHLLDTKARTERAAAKPVGDGLDHMKSTAGLIPKVLFVCSRARRMVSIMEKIRHAAHDEQGEIFKSREEFFAAGMLFSEYLMFTNFELLRAVGDSSGEAYQLINSPRAITLGECLNQRTEATGDD